MTGLQAWIDSGVLSSETASKLQEFAGLIHRWNPRINLTGYRSVKDIEQLLIGEAVAGLATLKLQDASVLDFGSGAGIPGLVWVQCEPSLRVLSLEVRHKKVAFQKEVLRQLSLAAEIVQGRFPEAVEGRTFRYIVSRAIRLDAPVWEQAFALLEEDGALIRFASAGAAEPGWKTIAVSDRTSLLIRHRRDVPRETR